MFGCLVFLISLQNSEVDFSGIFFKIKMTSSVLMIDRGTDGISKRTRAPGALVFAFASRGGEQRVLLSTLLWPTLLSAPGAAAVLPVPECSSPFPLG